KKLLLTSFAVGGLCVSSNSSNLVGLRPFTVTKVAIAFSQASSVSRSFFSLYSLQFSTARSRVGSGSKRRLPNKSNALKFIAACLPDLSRYAQMLGFLISCNAINCFASLSFFLMLSASVAGPPPYASKKFVALLWSRRSLCPGHLHFCLCASPTLHSGFFATVSSV